MSTSTYFLSRGCDYCLHPLTAMMKLMGILLFLASTATSAHAISDPLLYAVGGFTGGSIPFQTSTSSLNVSGSGSEQAGFGSATGAVSLAGDGVEDTGFIKASVSASTDDCCTGGGATILVGLSVDVFLQGPSDIAGTAAITTTLTGDFGCCSALTEGDVSLQTGPGLDNFRGTDPNAPTSIRGDYEALVVGRIGLSSVPLCHNCAYTPGPDFPVEVTTYIPFDAGQTVIRFAAELSLQTSADIGGGSSIDASHSAVFSIQLPDGFTYSSALTFAAPQQAPEPATLTMLAAGFLTAGAAARYRRRR